MKMFLKPSPGLIVRDPITKEPLPPEGKLVVRSSHWLRRLRDGDVSEVKQTEQAAPAEPAALPKSETKSKKDKSV